jgi:hypothetical protein
MMFSSPNACVFIARVCRTLYEIRTEPDAVPLSYPSRNRTRPDTLLQIKGRKKINHLLEIMYRVITKEMTEIKHVLLSHGVT